MDSIAELLDNWGFSHLHSLFMEEEFTIESFSSLQYECLIDLFPKAGPRNLFWTKYKSHFYPAQNLSECTTVCATTYDDYESLPLTPEPDTFTPARNVIIMNLVPNTIETYLKCADGIIIQNHYSKHNSLDNKNRNSLVKLIINAEFNNCANKETFVIKTERFLELTSEILRIFPKEPEFVYYIKYNPETRSLAKGKLWESFNYLKKRLRNMHRKNNICCEQINMDCEESVKFLETHFEPLEEVITAWNDTFKIRQKLVESPTSTTTIEEYFAKFPILKGPSGSALLLIDFGIKYSNYENKLFENWHAINSKIIKIADSKQSAEIQLAKQQKCPEILMLCILPFLLPYAYLKKNKNSKRVKLTKQEILENIFIHITDGNLLKENITIHMEKLKKYNLTFQPMVVFVGDTLSNIIASYVVVNNVLFKTESPLAAVDLCFKAFHVLNATYPEGSQLIWYFIQKAIYELTTRFDLVFITVNSLINEVENTQLP